MKKYIYFQMEFPIYRKKQRMLDGANTEESAKGFFPSHVLKTILPPEVTY